MLVEILLLLRLMEDGIQVPFKYGNRYWFCDDVVGERRRVVVIEG
jgi:hypothetical protein